VKELIVQQNQLSYTGTYARPLFQLWGAGGLIFGGLFDAFAPFSVALADIRAEGTAQSVADQAVTVAFGLEGIYRFRFDRVELSFLNFTDETFTNLPAILSAGDVWLRKAVPELRFQNHQFQYGGHCRLNGGSAEEVLQKVVKTDFKVQTSPLRAGIILRWTEADPGWVVQLTLDYSQIVDGGLFVWFAMTTVSDTINFSEVAAGGRALLESGLRQLDLTFSSK